MSRASRRHIPKTTHPADFFFTIFITQFLRRKGLTGVDPVCDSTGGEVRSSAEGDQSELSLKGCQARRNPIQYQYRSTTGRPGELLGAAVASLTVVSTAAACQRPRPPTHPLVSPLPTHSPKHRSGQTDGLSGQPSQGPLRGR